MTNLPVHYIIRDGGIVTDEGVAFVSDGLRGQIARHAIMDEHLRLETNLQPRNIDTVRTIVAKHLPEDEARTKPNWMRRWFTNPEPPEQPARDWKYEAYYGEIETPYADSFMDALNEAHLNDIGEARRTAAREAVLVAALHLETHLENLDNQTMIDTVVRSATQDCINIVREMLAKMNDAESGGA